MDKNNGNRRDPERRAGSAELILTSPLTPPPEPAFFHPKWTTALREVCIETVQLERLDTAQGYRHAAVTRPEQA